MGMTEKKQYIWEYLYSDNAEEIHFEQAELWNPYAELAVDSEQMKEDGTPVCRYNALYRYEDIFFPFFQLEGIPSEQKDKVLFDIFSHYLATVDGKSGVSFREFRKRKFGMDIEQGYYGELIKTIYGGLSKEKKYIVIHYLELQERIQKEGTITAACMDIYMKVVIGLFETGVMYKDRYRDRQYIFYVGKEKTDEGERLLQLSETLFLPFGYQVEVLWDKHFGLIGENQTLRVDAIQIM